MSEKKIMIVDDSEAARESLRFSLNLKKYDTVTAIHGADAFAKLSGGLVVDLIITDMNMPQMGGIELVEKVRGLKEYRFVPIIVLSTDEEKGKIALQKGASGFVLKSGHSSQEVIKLITRYLS